MKFLHKRLDTICIDKPKLIHLILKKETVNEGYNELATGKK